MNLKEMKKYRQSRQRERILQHLRSTDTHPTADWLYDKLKKEFPNLSLGTVYRNLSILTEQGLVKKIHFGSTFDRFESRLDPHYHLVCDQCGRVQDFEMPIYRDINEKAKKFTDFYIQRHRIEFFGSCSACTKERMDETTE